MADPKKKKKKIDAVVRPGGRRPAPKAPPKTVKNPAKKSGGSTSGGKSNKPKSATTLQKEAEARAIKRDNDLRMKSGMRYNQAAYELKFQIAPLKDALKTELARNRDQNLGDIDRLLTSQLTTMRADARLRGQGFLTSASDNEKAAADTQEGGFRNLVRERADSLTSVLEQGAGETDAMKAMLMSARNWHANTSEANRAYFDTTASINQGITDLNIDTKTGMANSFLTAEGEREKIWADFYNRRAETMTNLGNVYSQQAELMRQAKEMGVPFGTVRNKRMSDAQAGMEENFAGAANELGKSYKQKDLPQDITEYRGLEQVERRQSNTNLEAAMQFEPIKKAEGATLRKWVA